MAVKLAVLAVVLKRKKVRIEDVLPVAVVESYQAQDKMLRSQDGQVALVARLANLAVAPEEQDGENQQQTTVVDTLITLALAVVAGVLQAVTHSLVLAGPAVEQ